MKYHLVYSQIVRDKMIALKEYLTEMYGSVVARSVTTEITGAARQLTDNPEMGSSLALLFDIDTDFRYIYSNHNYLFYYMDNNRIIIAEMFNEKEDFMYKLFGISGRTEESVDYWGE